MNRNTNIQIHQPDTPPIWHLAAEPPEVPSPSSKQGSGSRSESGLPEELYFLPLRNTVMFPGLAIPITVAREMSIEVVRLAYETPDRLIGITTQKNSEMENPGVDDLYHVGVLANITRMMKAPDGSITIVIQGRSRIRVQEFVQQDPYFRARIEAFPETHPPAEEGRNMLNHLKNEASKIIQLSPNIPTQVNNTLRSIHHLDFLVHFIASNLNVEVGEKQEILEMEEVQNKVQAVLEYLSKELHMLELSEEIQHKVKHDLDKQQRDYILRQQMKTIQDELGEHNIEQEIDEFRKRASEKKWPEHIEELFEKEVNKLYRLNPSSPEYGVSLNYIEWMLDLPWQYYTPDRFNLRLARKILDNEHYGLEKVKERIIEYLAVLKLKGNMKAPILCFYGPPGVGKTSLGKSIAKSLNRQFVRISLGGVRDEAEIRGHRRTYIGAMPGRVLQGLKKAKTGNPVFMLDEVDKVGNDWRGDPGSALLEVLDPEQNSTFNDHYLEVDYDLSPIMFIATANTLETLHPALRDRMEIIEINGYTMQEKLEIAQRHLLPKVLEEHGLNADQVVIDETVLRNMIDGYTRESGVRNLSQKIGAVCRGAARQIVEEEVDQVVLTTENLNDYLGAIRFEKESYQHFEKPGVAVGLAWTAVGGEILFIETALLRGKGQLTLTGQLGDVMKESASLAYTFIKANADVYGIDYEVFKHWDIHIHIPAGAIPKDGPSAGITMLTAMASAFTQRLVKPKMAMTGEITLRGKVLPVGGIKEKVLAAARAGITTVILSKQNQKDIEEIETEHLTNMEIIYVEKMHEVLAHTLEPHPVENPMDLQVHLNENAQPVPVKAEPK